MDVKMIEEVDVEEANAMVRKLMGVFGSIKPRPSPGLVISALFGALSGVLHRMETYPGVTIDGDALLASTIAMLTEQFEEQRRHYPGAWETWDKETRQ